MGVIYKRRKQTRLENVSLTTKGVKMNYGEKGITQQIPLMGANGGLNNK